MTTSQKIQRRRVEPASKLAALLPPGRTAGRCPASREEVVVSATPDITRSKGGEHNRLGHEATRQMQHHLVQAASKRETCSRGLNELAKRAAVDSIEGDERFAPSRWFRLGTPAVTGV